MIVVNVCFDIIRIILCIDTMEDEGVDRTVMDCWQSQLGEMADFSPLLTFCIFDLKTLDVPQMYLRLCGTHG